MSNPALPFFCTQHQPAHHPYIQIIPDIRGKYLCIDILLQSIYLYDIQAQINPK